MKSLTNYILESQQVKLDSDGKERGFEYVDLGLPSGIMWATCNIGSTKPEDQGLLFQFGRVDGYKHNDVNHKFTSNEQNLKDTGNKAINKKPSGKLYSKNDILDLTDDAAHVNMGGKWRMPANDELKELLDNTTHSVETINGVKGMLFTSKINEHTLFMPFGVQWISSGFFDTFKKSGYIWSSQVESRFNYCAYSLTFFSDGRADIDHNVHSFGCSIRGVF